MTATPTPGWRLAIIVAASVIAPAGVAAAFVPARSDVSTSMMALTLAVVVTLLAAEGGRLAGVVAAVSSPTTPPSPWPRHPCHSGSDVKTEPERSGGDLHDPG